jgi:hypothetical protein
MAASAVSASLCGALNAICWGVSAVGSAALRAGRTRGAINVFFTLALPQTAQVTWPAAANVSKAVPDWNQLSKLWSLSHFSVNLIMVVSNVQ